MNYYSSFFAPLLLSVFARTPPSQKKRGKRDELTKTNRRNVNPYPKDSHQDNKSKLQQNQQRLKLQVFSLANRELF
jgi:hypothetical protein